MGLLLQRKIYIDIITTLLAHQILREREQKKPPKPVTAMDLSFVHEGDSLFWFCFAFAFALYCMAYFLVICYYCYIVKHILTNGCM